MTQPRFTIDSSVKAHDVEGMVILSGFLDDDRLRVQVSNEVWHMVLEYFRSKGVGDGIAVPDQAYGAVEKIGTFIIERRGVPQYGVLSIALG